MNQVIELFNKHTSHLNDVLNICLELPPLHGYHDYIDVYGKHVLLYRDINRLYKALVHLNQCQNLANQKYSVHYAMLVAKRCLTNIIIKSIINRIDHDDRLKIHKLFQDNHVQDDPFNYISLRTDIYTVKKSVVNHDAFVSDFLPVLKSLIDEFNNDSKVKSEDLFRAMNTMFIVGYPQLSEYLNGKYKELEGTIGKDPIVGLPKNPYKAIKKALSGETILAGIKYDVPEDLLSSLPKMDRNCYIKIKFKPNEQNNGYWLEHFGRDVIFQLFAELNKHSVYTLDQFIPYKNTLYIYHDGYQVDLILSDCRGDEYKVWLRELLALWYLTGNAILNNAPNDGFKKYQELTTMLFHYHGEKLKECFLDVLESVRNDHNDPYIIDDIEYMWY